MNKSDLIDCIAARAEISKRHAEAVVNCVFRAMTEALSRGDIVEIRGFGTFTARIHESRIGRNPRTGEQVEVPDHARAFFRAGKELRELVEGSREFGNIKVRNDITERC